MQNRNIVAALVLLHALGFSAARGQDSTSPATDSGSPDLSAEMELMRRIQANPQNNTGLAPQFSSQITPAQQESLRLGMLRSLQGDFSEDIVGVPEWWGDDALGYITFLKRTVNIQSAIIMEARNKVTKGRNAGILQPVFHSAESIRPAWFYWIFIGALVAGLVWFLIRFFGSIYFLNLQNASYFGTLPYLAGLALCAFGFLFVTQTAAANSDLLTNAAGVVSALVVGSVVGIVTSIRGISRSFAPDSEDIDVDAFDSNRGIVARTTPVPVTEYRRDLVRTTARAADIRSEDLEGMTTGEAVDVLVERAAWLKASDLFFLSDSNALTVSLRRFGNVIPVGVMSSQFGRRAIGHIKAIAGMDISEHRRPLDGRWVHESDDRRIDLRVNTTPTLYGEDLALRIWNRSDGILSLNELGLSSQDLGTLKAMLAEPSGLILVTGPTGAGKTATLYACLQHLAGGNLKLNTIEDPVEFNIAGVRQSQVNESIGIDFSDLLRSVFRQAPDVIMIGEIRDAQTATTAVRAANSGHLVLATLHAPTAAGAIPSMQAFGVKPFFLSTSLLGIVAQRLVRTLCPDCRTFVDLSGSSQTFADIRHLLDDGEGNGIYAPGRCDACLSSGYLGRTGLFEIMKVRKQVRNAIVEGATSREIEEVAIRNGMTEFRRGALLKVAKGDTSTEEIMRDIPAEQLGLED